MPQGALRHSHGERQIRGISLIFHWNSWECARTVGNYISAETGYKELIQRNVSNCSIACDCPTIPCAETQISSRMFALLFQHFVEQGKREVVFPSPLLPVGLMMPTILPHKECGLQPHVVLGIPEPEAAGAVQSPKWPSLSRRASTAHTHMKHETLQLSAG